MMQKGHSSEGPIGSGLLAKIGIVVNRQVGVTHTIEMAQQVEKLGFGAAWLTSGGPEDCMALLAVLAVGTGTLRLGTSVLQTYLRHPYVVATEANVIDQLAPGRFRLGVGPSHAPILQMLGVEQRLPFTHLSEYVKVLQSLVSTGSVNFEGECFRVTAQLNRSFDTPVMIGTLQPRAFELAGSLSDGAITWLCPPKYLREVGVPRLEQGANDAARERPPLIAHVAACLLTDGAAVYEEVNRSIPNIRFPSYQRMLTAAGFPEASAGRWTNDLIDQVVAWGDEEAILSRILALFDAGADEVLVRLVGAGPKPDQVVKETLQAIAAIDSSLAVGADA